MQSEDGEGAPPPLEPPASPEPPRPKRARRRQGLLNRLMRLAGFAGDVAEASIALLAAEARLARAALPHGIAWFVASLVFVVSLLTSGWFALLLALYRATGSAWAAIGWMAGISFVLAASSVVVLLRVIDAMKFVESRKRLHAWRRRKEVADEIAERTAE